MTGPGTATRTRPGRAPTSAGTSTASRSGGGSGAATAPRSARHGSTTGSGGGTAGYLQQGVSTEALYTAYGYDPLHDPAILAAFEPPAQGGAGEEEAMVRVPARGGSLQQGGGPHVLIRNPFRQESQPEQGPALIVSTRTALKLSSAAAPPISALGIDPAQLSRNDEEDVGSLPDFRQAFARAAGSVRAAMATLDQQSRSIKNEAVDFLGSQHRERQRSLDRNLSVLSADLVLARQGLGQSVDGWVRHLTLSGASMAADFQGAAAGAKRSLRERKEAYDRDLDPVMQERTSLISRIIDGEQSLYDNSRAASDAMEALRQTPENANLEDVIVSGIGDSWGALASLNEGPSGFGAILTAATKEAIIEFLPGRADLVKQKIADNYQQIGDTLIASFRCIPCKIDSGIAGIAGFVHQVAELGPRQVDDLLASSLESLHTTIASLTENALEAGETADENLVAGHDSLRDGLTQTAAAEADAETAQAGAQFQAVVDRLEANRDALPQSVAGIRERLIEAAEAEGLTPAQFADQAIQSALQLLAQVSGIIESEPALADASMIVIRDALLEQAVAAGRMRSEQLDDARGQRRDTVVKAGESVTEQVRKAMADLRPITRSFAQTAEAFLPPVEEGYSQAVQGMHAAIDQAGYAVDVAMTGSSNRSPGGGDTGSAGASSTGNGAAEGSGAEASGEAAGSTAAPSAAPQPPPPQTCDGCGPEEANQSEVSDDTAAASSTGDAAMSSEPNTATSDGSMSVDPGMSMPADPLSPTGYAERMSTIAQQPMTHDVMAKLVTDAKKKVPGKLTERGGQINELLDVTLNADIDTILGHVEGISATHGAFFERFFGSDSRGRGLRDSFGFWVRQELSWPATMDAKIAAFNNSLDGNIVGAAVDRLTAHMVGWNDSAQMETVMNNLTPSQLAALRTAPPAELAELRSGMNAEELERFNLMLSGGAEAVRSTALRREIDRLRWTEGIGEEGSEKVMQAIRTAEETSGLWAAEADAGRQRRDLFELEDPEVQQQRRQRSFQRTEEAFGELSGVSEQARRGAASGIEGPGRLLTNYATASRDRFRQVYDENTRRYTWEQYTQDFDPEYARVIEMGLTHGFDSEEAAAAELYAETHRTRGPPRAEVMQRVLQPSEADAVRMGGYDAQARASGLETAEEKRRRIFALYAEYGADSRGESLQDAPSMEDVQAEISGHIDTAFEDDENAREMMNGWVNNARGDPLATIEYAIAHENFDVARTQLSRMDRTEIDQLMTGWDTAHPSGPSFEEAMGLGEHRFSASDYLIPVLLGPAGLVVNQMRGANYNWGAAFSGDEANELELLMNGVPQNEFEAGHIAQRTMDMQIEQSTFAGQMLAYGEYSDLVENAARLRRMMGTGDAELDSMGRISTVDERTGQPVIVGNFNPDGSFDPPDGTTAGDFSAAMGLARFYSDNYTQAVDRVSNYIATAIVLTAAIVTTFLTGGAAASIWIPMLVTMGAGVLAMGTTAMIKGTRYSKDQMLTDLATNIVSAATAGIGGAATVYLRGAATAGQAGGRAALGALSKSWRMSEEALSIAVRGADKIDDAARMVGGAAGAADDIARAGGQLAQPKMWQNMVVGGLSGGASGATGAAMDPRFRNSEDYWENVAHGFGRGFLGGAAGAGITEAAMRGGGQILNRLGRGRAERLARQMNLSDDELAEFVFRNAEAFSSRGYMDVLNRSLSGGLSGSLSKGLEIGYDRFLRNQKMSADSVAEEMFWAGLQNAFQSGAEGIAEGARRRHVSGDAAEHRWVEDQGWAGEQQMLRQQAAANDNESTGPADLVPGRRGADELDDLPGRRLRSDAEGLAEDTDVDPLQASRGLDEDTDVEVQAFDASGSRLDKDGQANAFPQGTLDTGPMPIVARLREAGAPGAEEFGPRIMADLDLSRHLLAAPLPAGTEIQASDRTSRDLAMANYVTLKNREPDREVGLAFNVLSGEYAVIQGAGKSVDLPGPERGWTMERHAHPNAVSGDRTALLSNILPSGIGGDATSFVRAARLSHRASGEDSDYSYTATIDARINGAEHETIVTIRLKEGEVAAIEVNFFDPRSEQRSTIIRNSVEDYAQFAAGETGISAFLGRNRASAGKDGASTDSEALGFRLIGGAGPDHRRSLSDDDRAQVGRLASQLESAAAARQPAHLADTALRALGLVGSPDAMIRLHAIINDDGIDMGTRRVLAQAVQDATQRQMIASGELRQGEQIIMLFHGATDRAARSIVEDGIDMSLRPGGADDDFADGLYLSQHLESAMIYRHPNGPSDNDATGAVIPFMVRGRDLGSVVDVTPGGRHREAFEIFVTENSEMLSGRRILPEHLQRILNQDPTAPLPFGTFDAEGRGILFQAFLDSLGGTLARPDIVFGDLGGTLTSGRQMPGQPTDQAAIKTQRLAEILNPQHVRGRTLRSDSELDPVLSTPIVPESVRSRLQPDLEFVKARASKPRDAEAFLERLTHFYKNNLEDFAGFIHTSDPAERSAYLQRIKEAVEADETGHFASLISEINDLGFSFEPIRFIQSIEHFEQQYGALFRKARAEGSQDTPSETVPSLVPAGAGHEPDAPLILPDPASTTFKEELKRDLLEIEPIRLVSEALGEDFDQIFDAFAKSTHGDGRLRKLLDQSGTETLTAEHVTMQFFEFLVRSAAQRDVSLESVADTIPRLRTAQSASEETRFSSAHAKIADAYDKLLSLVIPADFDEAHLARLSAKAKEISESDAPGQGTDKVTMGMLTKGDNPITIGQEVEIGTMGVGKVVGFDGGVMLVKFTDSQTTATRVPVAMPDVAALGAQGAGPPFFHHAEPGIRQRMKDRIDTIRRRFGHSDYNDDHPINTVALAVDGSETGSSHPIPGVNNQFAPSLLEVSYQMTRTFLASFDIPYSLMHGQFATHAEFHALLRLRQFRLQNGEAGMPPVVHLYVDRVACGACRKYLEFTAAFFGIETLVVHAVGHEDFPPLVYRGK